MKGPSGSPFRALLSSSFSGQFSYTPPSIDWNQMERTVKAIKGFLVSLNRAQIGGGFMLFEKDEFVLKPRSNYFNGKWMQSISSIGNKNARYRVVLEGFTLLRDKILFLKKRISECEFDLNSSVKGDDLHTSLVRIQLVIAGSASLGLDQMAANYFTVGKEEKGRSIKLIGLEIFKYVNETTDLLTQKLIVFFPEINVKTMLEMYYANAKYLLDNRNIYRHNLRMTSCSMSDGLRINCGMVDDALRDSTFDNKPNRDALRVAANVATIPLEALPIPTQGGCTMWQPVRLVVEGQDIVRQEGVFGACERSSPSTDNLCNLYFRIDPDTRDIAISSGYIGSGLQAAQLCFTMNETIKLVPETNGRWIVHQLNSMWKEKPLIREVHANVPLKEEYFQDILGREDISLLHVNTCFNAASMIPKEDAKSFIQINIDSLAFMARFLLVDLSALLHEVPLLSQLFKETDESFKFAVEKCVITAEGIKEIKKRIQDNKENGKLTRLDALESEISQLKEDKEAEGLEKSHSAPELGVVSADEERSKEIEEFIAEFVKIEDELPTEIKDLKNQLERKQKQLEEELLTLHQSTLKAIGFIQDIQNPSFNVSNALHLLQVYERVLSLQLKPKDHKPLSRCAEVESFIMLYRELKIKPVFMCKTGLDRSGAVRALADALSRLERELVTELLAQRKKRYGLKPDDEKIVRFEIRRKLFHLIENLDSYRNELFTLVNEIIAANSNAKLISDLKLFEQAEFNSFNIREALVDKINEMYPETHKDGKRGEELLLALSYFEFFATQLLGTEIEKTLFSTGVAGEKFLQDANVAKRKFANFHPLERLPPFIFAVSPVENADKSRPPVEQSEIHPFIEPPDEPFKTIKLMETPTKMTSAGIKLILRLSKLRGN